MRWLRRERHMLPGFDSCGRREPGMSFPRLLVHEDPEWRWQLERKGLVVRLAHEGDCLDWVAYVKRHQKDIEATRPWLMSGWLNAECERPCVGLKPRRRALELEMEYTVLWLYARVLRALREA